MRKILALILTLTMVLGLGVTAFAETQKETVEGATITLEVTVNSNSDNDPNFEFPSSLTFDILYDGASTLYAPLTVAPVVDDTVTASATVTLNLEYEVTEDDEDATAEARDAAIAAELDKYSFAPTVVPNFAVSELQGPEVGITIITYDEKDAQEGPEITDPEETDVDIPHDTTQTHTITINNPDQNVDHTYKAYQVFKGDLNDDESVLSNIVWGDGVDGDAIIEILNAAIADGEKPEYLDDSEWDAFVTKAQAYAEAQMPDDYDEEEEGDWEWTFTTAAEVADFISEFTSTNGDTERDVDTGTEDAGLIDTFAAICADNVTEEAAGESAQEDPNDPTVYTIPVTGDGYYLVIDETTALNDEETLASDTVSKYLLQVIRDREINAKDTGLNPDKKILKDAGKETEERVAADSANIGDTVPFSVEIKVPDTRKYVDHFVFIMNDQLPEGLTYSDNLQIDIGGKTFDNIDMYINDDVYILDGQIADEDTELPDGAALFTDYDPAYAVEEDLPEYFVTQAGGQAIKVNFNDFKAFVEEEELIGETITITYTAVVNDDAVFGPSGNENEVKFDYSSNPNNDYNGDDFDDDDPHGTTPSSTTKTYVTTMKLNKVDGETGEALEGAEFAIIYDKVNYYKLTGERFIEDYDKTKGTPEDIWDATETDETDPETGDNIVTYTLKDGISVDEDTTYWALNDGSYTTTDPTTEGINDTQYKKVDGKYVTAVLATYVKYVEGDPEEGTITVTTGADGVIHVEGVEAGTYTIKEIKAPDGYNTLKETLDVEIGWIDPAFATTTDAEEAAAWEELSPEQQDQAKTTGGFYIISNSENASFSWNGDEGTMAWEITIANNKGTELPSTGGIGTTIFYIVGGLLAVGAGVVLVAKKRMGKEEN